MARAPAPWNPDLTYYDFFKRVSHGINYGLTASGLSRVAHIPYEIAKPAWQAHHAAFPGIHRYDHEVEAELRETGSLTTPFGRERQFLGAFSGDKHIRRKTVREGLAHRPQNMVVTILNIGMLRVWREFDPGKVQLLQQGHDSIMGQVRPRDLGVLDHLCELMTIPVEVRGRTMTIPVEVKTGRKWSECK